MAATYQDIMELEAAISEVEKEIAALEQAHAAKAGLRDFQNLVRPAADFNAPAEEPNASANGDLTGMTLPAHRQIDANADWVAQQGQPVQASSTRGVPPMPPVSDRTQTIPEALGIDKALQPSEGSDPMTLLTNAGKFLANTGFGIVEIPRKLLSTSVQDKIDALKEVNAMLPGMREDLRSSLGEVLGPIYDAVAAPLGNAEARARLAQSGGLAPAMSVLMLLEPFKGKMGVTKAAETSRLGMVKEAQRGGDIMGAPQGPESPPVAPEATTAKGGVQDVPTPEPLLSPAQTVASPIIENGLNRKQGADHIADAGKMVGDRVPDIGKTIAEAKRTGARVSTPEGAKLVEEARQGMADAINAEYSTPKERADAIARARNLVEFRQTHADPRVPPAIETWYNGDRVAYTGEFNDKGEHTLIYLDGNKAGEFRVTHTPPNGVDPFTVRNQQEWRNQQADFRKLNPSTGAPTVVGKQALSDVRGFKAQEAVKAGEGQVVAYKERSGMDANTGADITIRDEWRIRPMEQADRLDLRRASPRAYNAKLLLEKRTIKGDEPSPWVAMDVGDTKKELFQGKGISESANASDPLLAKIREQQTAEVERSRRMDEISLQLKGGLRQEIENSFRKELSRRHLMTKAKAGTIPEAVLAEIRKPFIEEYERRVAELKDEQSSLQKGNNERIIPGETSAGSLYTTETSVPIGTPKSTKIVVENQSQPPAGPMEANAGVTPATIAKGIEGFSNLKVVDDIRKIIAPTTRGTEAQGTGLIMRHNLAQMAHSADLAKAALAEAKTHFDSQPPAANYEFYDRSEKGLPQVDSRVQAFSDVLHKGLDERRIAIQALGTGKLQTFIENYLPHAWENPEKAQTFFSQYRRPFEGSKSFLKQRTIPTLADGIAAGLKPISDNPVDLVLMKMSEMDKYLMAHKVMGEMKDVGTLQFIRAGHRAPDGWVKINDQVSSVYYKNADKELVQAGNYYSPEPAARIINNYLSPGLRSKSDLFRLYQGTGNLLNQAQLGLSAFHLGFTSLDAGISKVALGINKIAHGQFAGGLGDIVSSPAAPVTNILKGNKLYKEWFAPGTQGAEIGKYINALESGGGRPTMDTFYRTKFAERMKQAWRQGNPVGAAMRLPGAVLEATAKPIMEYVVPRQKLGVFMDLAKMEMDRNPGMSLEQQRATMAKIWNSVDNRMGQLVYDNIFWNNVTKDLGMASVRSLGWNLGTIREVVGGAGDIATQGLRALQGQKPEMTYRMAYTLALPTVVGTLGAITQYLMTGEPPKDLKDLYFPRTGEMDEHGDPQRISMPSYMKDIYHYYTATGKTVRNKLHPMIGMVGDMLANQDFYGTEIRHADDPWFKQLLQLGEYAGKQALPIGVRNIQRNIDIEGKLTPKGMLPFIGITPAPRDVNQTKAEKFAREWQQQTLPSGSKTQAQTDEAQMKAGIRRDLSKGNQKSFREASQAGKLSKGEAGNILRTLTMTPLQRSMQSMPVDVAIKTFKLATPEERKAVRQLMAAKIQNFIDHGSPEDVNAQLPELRRVWQELSQGGGR